MGKKSKRSGKEPKRGPGKLHREEVATMRDIQAFASKLDMDYKGKNLFPLLNKREDCPICLVRLPLKGSDFVYMPCCGKDMCCACICAYQNTSKEKNRPCPFCRSPRPKSHDEVIEQMERRINENDTIAMHTLAHTYLESEMNKMKGLRLLLFASELGE